MKTIRRKHKNWNCNFNVSYLIDDKRWTLWNVERINWSEANYFAKIGCFPVESKLFSLKDCKSTDDSFMMICI